MANEPTEQEAQLILQLYRLRQEPEMRKARLWWRDDFWPESADDYLRVEMALCARENRWLRQVATYWGMAASFVLHGTLREKAFLDPAVSGEMFAVFAKVRPFLKELRRKTRNPELLHNVERVISRSKTGREHLRHISKRVAARGKKMKRTEVKKGRR